MQNELFGLLKAWKHGMFFLDILYHLEFCSIRRHGRV